MSDIEYLKKYYDGDIDIALEQLKKGVPVQYIVGNVDFYGYKIIVNNNVLIPRFETEELVNRTINYVKKYFNSPSIVDLGCGSGCISIALSLQLNVCIDAVDISPLALEVARENIISNNASVNCFLGDMFSPLDKKYDVIVSNPPYISYDEEIDEMVRLNEPNLALYADNDGLYFYEEILKNCKDYLNDKFMIAFEIGCTQGDRIKEMALKYLENVFVSVEKDLSNRDRFVFIFNNIK